ncbi:MAG: single-stranded-DNA-specific exonuclease RecJ [Fimbriimonadaceae bacterium]|nr:Single-stranded-DNA-specific exonuclease RecJ [Fimbriimonadaceae bacterium]MCL4285429.1 single-stranded-DNA-specific exonuclease RecJ [Fimbriimonadaceae bacterium]QOJ11861.1 MAG: single-stranded-DNA-specific exonuclease RecJ [Chthonomonadaceae bacterium]RIJ98618.1 MAG: single-stranded-DNA-specific exonuclease RecJ [Armatimonadota bacterium]
MNRTVDPIWSVQERDTAAEQALASELGAPMLLAMALVQRSITDAESADHFLNPKIDDFHDPALLPDYELAAKEILGARERGERIFVHGDYDVDGVTAAALLGRFLEKIGCRVDVHVPHRMKEGYGIHHRAIDDAKQRGAKLFLTCDCGISAFDQIDAAREAGMRVVVTDHHAVGPKLPQAHAVVNPHRSDSKYPFPALSGAGVVLKLCAGLARDVGLNLDSFYGAFLDLAVLGTVADVMPLVGENRVIASLGLKRLADSKKPGIRALLRQSGIQEKAATGFKAHHISFGLGPRLNAAGRLDDAALSLDLLLERDETKAATLAGQIESLNSQRRSEQDQIAEEAVTLIENEELYRNPAIVVAREGWHHGLIGIVASRIVDQYHRPAFVITLDRESNEARGSARSIPGFHIADALRELSDLASGGGHEMAGGFSLEAKSVEAFAESLVELARRRIPAEAFAKRIPVDAEVAPSEAGFEAALQLRRLEPFGEGNPEPLLLVRNVEFTQIVPTRNPDHPQVMLRAEGVAPLRCPAFSLGARLSQESSGMRADVLVRVVVDEWRGTTQHKWHIRDYRPAETP